MAVGHDRFGLALGDDRAGIHADQPVDDLQKRVQNVLDPDDRQPVRLQLDDQRDELCSSASVSPPPISSSSSMRGWWPVRGPVRAACGRAIRALPPAGWHAGSGRCAPASAPPALRRAAGKPRAVMRRGEHVLEYAHAQKGPRHLVGAGDARAATVRGTQPVMSAPSKQDLAGARRKRAGENAEQRRLAGAVGADNADGLAGSDAEIDTVQHLEGAETLVDPRALPAWAGQCRYLRSRMRQPRPCTAAAHGAQPSLYGTASR